MGGFGEATAVRRVAEGRYAATLDPGYGFDEALHGGYLMAVMVRAAVEASAHPHPIATSANFLRVAPPGPAEVLVEPRRSGRTTTVARVSLVQDDQAIVDATVTTGSLDPDAEPRYAVPPGPLPPIAECLSFEATKPQRGFGERVDMRFDRTTMGWLDGEPTGVPEMRAYFRLREDHDTYEPDAALLALAVDALPPVVLNTGAYGWAPTVELTWHMRAVPRPGWLALYGRSRLVSDGWFDEDVEVWDSAGRLVAQSRQIAREGRTRH